MLFYFGNESIYLIENKEYIWKKIQNNVSLKPHDIIKFNKGTYYYYINI